MFDDFVQATLFGTATEMKEKAVKAVQETELFSKERRVFVETLIQTGEVLAEMEECEQTSSNLDATNVTARKAYCFQTAYVLSRTTRRKCSQNKRAKEGFKSVLKQAAQAPIPKTTGIVINPSFMGA